MLRISRPAAQLLVIDVQERLVPRIEGYREVVAQVVRMIRAAQVLDLPITVSEQYVRGLGPTVAPVLAAAGDAARFEKMSFGACGEVPLRGRLLDAGRPEVLLCGIETHVCVLQTAIELLEAGTQPVVLADAVGSRSALDRETALHRLRGAGVLVTTVESAIFEMMERCGTDVFKRMLPIVR